MSIVALWPRAPISATVELLLNVRTYLSHKRNRLLSAGVAVSDICKYHLLERFFNSLYTCTQQPEMRDLSYSSVNVVVDNHVSALDLYWTGLWPALRGRYTLSVDTGRGHGL